MPPKTHSAPSGSAADVDELRVQLEALVAEVHSTRPLIQWLQTNSAHIAKSSTLPNVLPPPSLPLPPPSNAAS